MLVQGEGRLKKIKDHSLHLTFHKGTTSSKPKPKKKNKKKDKAPMKVNEDQIHKEQRCYFCRKTGHFKSVLKGRVGSKRKGFVSIQPINRTNEFLYMGNRMKARIEGIGTYRLILDTGCRTDLENCLYVPDCAKNLVFVAKLDNVVSTMDILEVFINEVERQLERKVKVVRSDKDGEYYRKFSENGQCPGPFAKFLEHHNIFTQNTMLGTPQQDGVAERLNRTPSVSPPVVVPLVVSRSCNMPKQQINVPNPLDEHVDDEATNNEHVTNEQVINEQEIAKEIVIRRSSRQKRPGREENEGWVLFDHIPKGVEVLLAASMRKYWEYKMSFFI
ncbi:Retrovirus-related Pol polyprotein from transposon TNT 1-94 [Senna tora]|uniref:Retrovirus-related Pol polyprotein from transposon TNT 1-94 n=1 Tax=Senna tora TaxID=362788 RepID=A0A834X7J7_9FABA|nr:Retrovirus-related Pol polyprotein from transposon TNT 1-94 [Senna tora]